MHIFQIVNQYLFGVARRLSVASRVGVASVRSYISIKRSFSLHHLLMCVCTLLPRMGLLCREDPWQLHSSLHQHNQVSTANHGISCEGLLCSIAGEEVRVGEEVIL